ncbi:hypothetical protein [Spiroplasma tabanidicola]|uniref:MOLPALP family lipoprotein n=1 Tax=Spiroplasma tabanidicola TaxID=324079 RepID=A0A6I6C7Y5_9MOLU|nr:hypothetical protein [Spiroplasma tabanidicola]QGS51876.1 MOLPALP family lipoprotein [Spiroplasma tabanidicola]
MKKILSIAASIVVITSSASLTVSCGKDEVVNSISSKSMNILLKEVAKTAYLNNVEKYDFNYVFDNIVKNQQIQKFNGNPNLDVKDEFASSSKYSDIYNKYFESKLYDENNVDLDGVDLKNNVIKPEDGSFLTPILKNLPAIFEAVGNRDFLGIGATILKESGLVDFDTFARNPILTIISKVLPSNAFSNISKAFYRKEYENMSVQNALNASMIGFVNALNKFCYPASTGKRPKNLGANTEKEVLQNFTPALIQLTQTIQDIMDGTAKFTLDLFNNIDTIADIVNFVKMLFMYMTGFIERFSPDPFSEDPIEKSKPNVAYDEISITDMIAYRNSNFKETINSNLNLEAGFNFLLKMLYINDGMAAKNLIRLLFYEDFANQSAGDGGLTWTLNARAESTGKVHTKYTHIVANLTSTAGVQNDVKNMANEIKSFITDDFDNKYTNTGGISAFIRAILNSIITEGTNKNLGNTLTCALGWLSSETKDDPMLKVEILGLGDYTETVLSWGFVQDIVVDAINDFIPLTEDGRRAMYRILKIKTLWKNVWGTIWNNNLLAYAAPIFDLKIPLNEPNTYAKSIADVVENFDIIKKLGLYDIFGFSFDPNVVNSLQNLAKYFLSTKSGNPETNGTTPDNGAGSKEIPVTILEKKKSEGNNTKFKLDFKNLSNLTVNIGAALNSIIKNPDSILNAIGIDDNQQIIKNSLADNAITLFSDINGVQYLLSVIQSFLYRFDIKQKLVAKQMFVDYSNITENQVDESIINLYQYQYRVRDKNITIDLKRSADRFTIKRIRITDINK